MRNEEQKDFTNRFCIDNFHACLDDAPHSPTPLNMRRFSKLLVVVKATLELLSIMDTLCLRGLQ